MNYEKLTLDRFILNLKESKYQDLTGARRAIGKVKSWSTKDREKAREVADKHFGAPAVGGGVKLAAAKKKKTATKKTAAKKTAPKAKKTAKKAAPILRTSGVAPKKETTSAPRKPVTRSASEGSTRAPQDALGMGKALLTFCESARHEADHLRKTNALLDMGAIETEVRSILLKAVKTVNISVPDPAAIPTATASPRIAVPTGVAPNAVPVGVNPITSVNGTYPITPEERQTAELVRPAATSLAELPRPGSS